METEIAQAQLEGELYRFYSTYGKADEEPNVPEIARWYRNKRGLLNEALRSKYQVCLSLIGILIGIRLLEFFAKPGGPHDG